MSRSLSTTLYLRPGSISIYGNFYLCCSYHFRLFFGLWIVQIWSINYAWRFGSVKIHNHCLYWCAFVLTWAEILFSTVCYFYSYYWWSVNYTSRVIKFHNFFSDMLRNWGQGYIWRLFLLSFMDRSQLSSTFFSLFPSGL